MRKTDRIRRRREEFNAFVWNHAEDPFQVQFDVKPPLFREQRDFLERLLTHDNLSDPDRLAVAIATELRDDIDHLYLLLQLVGLTRNKFVQDIKVKVRTERLRTATSSPSAIVRSSGALAAEYMAAHVNRVFGNGTDESISQYILECLNQATWPGYIRQERAKRMGHQAEFRIASTLRAAGLKFDPEEKAENPLCPDVIIDEMSYDLVTPSRDEAFMRVVSTVHTANIGQYGESKDALEIRKAIDAMERAGDRDDVTLVAFIDGIGFESNRAGLDDVLDLADEFSQFRTIWKVLVIAATKVGHSAMVAIPEQQMRVFADFMGRYRAELVDITSVDTTGWVDAGEARVKILR